MFMSSPFLPDIRASFSAYAYALIASENQA